MHGYVFNMNIYIYIFIFVYIYILYPIPAQYAVSPVVLFVIH